MLHVLCSLHCQSYERIVVSIRARFMHVGWPDKSFIDRCSRSPVCYFVSLTTSPALGTRDEAFGLARLVPGVVAATEATHGLPSWLALLLDGLDGGLWDAGDDGGHAWVRGATVPAGAQRV